MSTTEEAVAQYLNILESESDAALKKEFTTNKSKYVKLFLLNFGKIFSNTKKLLVTPPFDFFRCVSCFQASVSFIQSAGRINTPKYLKITPIAQATLHAKNLGIALGSVMAGIEGICVLAENDIRAGIPNTNVLAEVTKVKEWLQGLNKNVNTIFIKKTIQRIAKEKKLTISNTHKKLLADIAAIF